MIRSKEGGEKILADHTNMGIKPEISSTAVAYTTTTPRHNPPNSLLLPCYVKTLRTYKYRGTYMSMMSEVILPIVYLVG